MTAPAINRDSNMSKPALPTPEKDGKESNRKKVPLLPPKPKPKPALPREQDSSGGIYMKLSSSSLATQQNSPSQYAALCNATRQQPTGSSAGRRIVGSISMNRLMEALVEAEKV